MEFAELARQQLPRLYSLARQLVDDEAKDLVQECLLRVTVIISNGVINLSARKMRTLFECARVLRPGGPPVPDRCHPRRGRPATRGNGHRTPTPSRRRRTCCCCIRAVPQIRASPLPS
jgi:hypothetical protein